MIGTNIRFGVDFEVGIINGGEIAPPNLTDSIAELLNNLEIERLLSFSDTQNSEEIKYLMAARHIRDGLALETIVSHSASNDILSEELINTITRIKMSIPRDAKLEYIVADIHDPSLYSKESLILGCKPDASIYENGELSHDENTKFRTFGFHIHIGTTNIITKITELFPFLDANNKLETNIPHLSINYRKGPIGIIQDVRQWIEENHSKINNIFTDYNPPVKALDKLYKILSGFSKSTTEEELRHCTDVEFYGIKKILFSKNEAATISVGKEWNKINSLQRHLHIFNKDKDIELIKLLDLFVGTASVIMLSDEDRIKERKRRTLYGMAGSYRLTPYGIEYRVLSSNVLKTYLYSATTMFLAIATLFVHMAAQEEEKQKLLEIDTKNTINYCDKEQAKEQLKIAYNIFLKMVDKDRDYQIKCHLIPGYHNVVNTLCKIDHNSIEELVGLPFNHRWIFNNIMFKKVKYHKIGINKYGIAKGIRKRRKGENVIKRNGMA